MVTKATTRKLLEEIEEGMLDPMTVLLAALNHMSEDEVRDMCEANEFLPEEEAEEEEEPEELLADEP